MRTIVLLLVLLSLSLAKEVVLIMGFPNPYKKMQLLQGSAQEEGLSLKGVYLRRQEEVKALQLPQADLYLLDLPQEEMRKEVEKRLAGREYIVLSPPPTGKDAGLTARLFTYYNSGGSQNFKNMFRLLLGKPAEPPQVIPPVGFYTPSKGVLGELPEEAKTQRPVIILFHRQDIVSENTHILDQLMKAFEKKGLEAYGFFYPELEGLGKHKNLLLQEGKPFPSLLINLRLMYFNYEEEKRALEELGLVVMGGITYRGKLEEWQKSPSGLPVASIPFYYTLPEYLGIIDNTVVGYDDGEKRAIDHMLQNFVARVIAWKGLSEKPNADKRVAVIYYNYPPGEKNILASNLNVIRSAELLLKTAREKGYNVETPSEKELQNHLTHIIGLYYRKPVRKDLVDCLDFKSYRAWFDSLPEWVKKDVLSYWGEPERDNYLKGECFPIPIYRAGNFAFLPLAPRGADYLKSKDIYHSTKVPPSHYYLAFYLYVRENFDVIVHFGTHGTQEWTPGKERALDLWDYPYMTLGDKPVVYPYIVDNIGEALNAKRRGRALIISHQTPAFAPSGTYGELEELHQLLHKEAQTEGKLKETIRKDIARKAFKAKLAQDIGYKTQRDILKDFETFSNKLHEHIHHVASQNVPLGLHTFGETKERELIHLTILQILGREWVSRWEKEEYQEFLAQPLEKVKASRAFRAIVDCLEGRSQIKECERIKELYHRFDASQELKSFFDALEGRYILTSYGGDPIKNPDSLPTGKNLYGFDPTRVPTRQAWQSAVEITDQWLKEYYAKHKSYPSKVAFSLWSTETMRHFGVAEAQILYLLGVRPKWDAGGRVVGLEVIPKRELGRPRVDVVVSATGLYRDHFPNLLNMINHAVRIVSSLEEENNTVRENTQKIKEMLIRKGYSHEEAQKLASIRSFSNESGAYGSGLDEAVFQTSDRKKLSELFLFRMGFVYDEGASSVKVEGLFEENLKDTQAVLLSRSSNLYGMLTTDDPFQYLGGLALSVEVLSGRKPEVLISNLRNNQKIVSAEDFLITEVRSRYLNPEYVRALMKEGYSGVNELLNTLNNLYGWQVVSPQIVKSYIWKEFEEVYIKDKYKLGTSRWLMENPSAYGQIKDLLSKVSPKAPSVGGYGFGKSKTSALESVSSTYQGNLKGFVLEKVVSKEVGNTPPMGKSIQFLMLLAILYSLGLIHGLRKRVWV